MIQEIYIDLLDNHVYESIFNKQYDSGRIVHFYLTDGGEKLDVSATSILFETKLPNGKVVQTHCTQKGEFYELIIENVITQYASNRIPYQIKIIQNNAVIRSITGNIKVEDSVIAPEDIIETNYPNIVVTLNSDGKIENDLLYDATTSRKGIVQLEDSMTSDSTDKAATPHSVNMLREYTNEKLDDKVNKSEVGQPNGVAELDSNGIIISSQLPSYVDDVLEFDTKSDFPKNGESGKIYVDKSNNVSYRWSGSQYIMIASDLTLGETSSTAYRGDRGKIAFDHSQEPHVKERELTLEEYNSLPNTKYSDGVTYYITDGQPEDLQAKNIGFDKTKTGLQSYTNVQDVIDHLTDLFYPVGSIYMSTNPTSPAVKFGGTWEQIKDRFLVSAGGNYTVNATGGSANAIVPYHTHTFTGTEKNYTSGNQSASHTHTTSVTPAGTISGGSHKHDIFTKVVDIASGVGYTTVGLGYGKDQVIGTKDASHTHTFTGTAKNYTSGNQSASHTHTTTITPAGTNSYAGTSGNTTNANLPPYLAVYMWKRTK